MKKVILFFAAIMALYSCGNEDTFYPSKTQQVDFEGTNIDISVRCYIKKNPNYKNRYSIYADFNPYLGPGYVPGYEMELVVAAANSDKGLILFERTPGLEHGDCIFYSSGAFAAQDTRDSIIESDTLIPYTFGILINDELQAELEWIQLIEIEFRIKYLGGSTVIGVYYPDWLTCVWQIPEHNYIMTLESEKVYF